MHPRLIAVALLSLGSSLPAAARAADPYTPEWLVYSVQQVCQVWADGIGRCFPVATVGPAPTGGLQPMMPAMPMPQPYVNPYLAYMPRPAMPPPAVPHFTAPPPPPPVAIAEPPAPPPPVAVEPPPPPPVANTPAAPPAQMEDSLAHFDFDSAEFNATGRAAVDVWRQTADPDLRVRLTGHADRFGPSAYNVILSRRRAETVRRYLVDKGMKPENLEIVAQGESSPVVHCKGRANSATIACLAPNRRVVIEPL